MKKGIFAFFIFLSCLTPICLFAYEDQDKMAMPPAAPSVAAADAAVPAVAAPSGEAAADKAAPAVAAPADMATSSVEAADKAAPTVAAPSGETAPATAPAVAAPASETGVLSSAVEVGNKICPVSGEKIGSKGPAYKIEHMGKIYNLCCSMCEKDFKSDPTKYISKVEEELKSGAGTNDDAGKAGGVY